MTQDPLNNLPLSNIRHFLEGTFEGGAGVRSGRKGSAGAAPFWTQCRWSRILFEHQP
jgi:hypothetical protein